jgi:cysteinyl-tRNA synthetase
VCGLTPSARAHLGHARSFLFFDLLRRYLVHKGYRVTYVQNVTDIDDRSINESKQTGEYYHAIVERHYAEFKAAMRALGVREYDVEPYATQYIAQIQTMIVELLAGGHAYVSKDGIYYRVATFPRYGRLAHRNIDELEAGARIEVDERKEDPLDFALWKFAKPGEPSWPFDPYGEGRPGWHIECSAMARELLDPQGEGFDIHGGGADLIFPHHENEIAQSEPLMANPPMANFWVHGGLLLFDNRKMSKSLGNFEPLSDLLLRHDPQALRLLFLRTGYRKVMNFTEDAMSSAYADLDRLKSGYQRLRVGGTASDAGALLGRIEKALDDDMNAAVALAELLSFAGSVETGGSAEGPSAALDDYARALALLGIEPRDAWLDDVANKSGSADIAGFATFVPPETAAILREALGELIAFDANASVDQMLTVMAQHRRQARAEKNWALADRIRDGARKARLQPKDGPDGTTLWTVDAG